MVTTINKYQFYGFRNLRSVTLHDEFTSIGDYAFAYCNRLSEVNFGNSLTTIGAYAFERCYSIRKVIFPTSITTIDNGSFYYSNLSEVYYMGTEAMYKEISINNCPNLSYAKVYYYLETAPETEGNYWYFDHNKNIKKW